MTLQEIKEAFHDIVHCERGSGRYNYAKTQLLRLLSPFVSATMVSILVLAMLVFCTKSGNDKAVIAEVDYEQAQMDELEEVPEQDVIEPTDVVFDDALDFQTDVPMPQVSDPSVQGSVSPKPAPFNAVAMNYRSPVMMTGIYGARMTGQIGKARAAHGGTEGGERSVMNALRWLKTKQNKDGSWPNVKPAMTGLALLCYLAHGELPSSPEFGSTVRSGIEYLINSYSDKTGTFAGHDGNNYAHLIATYAMCEAYSMTKNPQVKEVAEKALVKIVQGQHANGGWDYKMAQTTRDDTSYMGWAAQAIKAGYMARDLEVEGLGRAYTNAPKGFLVNYHKDGGFGYTSPSHTSGLTAVGTLCMQLMGKGNHEAVRKSAKVMDEWVLGWIPDKSDINTKAVPSSVGTGANQQYYAYYAAQSRFQTGGSAWDKWNAVMRELYPAMQKVQSKEISNYVDHTGTPQSIGHWENGDVNKDSGPFIMDTCLACLQMEVYYRYLPTYGIVGIEDSDLLIDKTDDVGIEIELY